MKGSYSASYQPGDYQSEAAKLPFMTVQVRQEFDPHRVVELMPMVQRITAPNPGLMTGPGTNAFIIGRKQLTVIDPGPAIEPHIQRIADFCDGRLEQILLTHTHPDHSPGTALLQKLTGAPAKASAVKLHRIYDDSFSLDQALSDGDRVVNAEYSIQVIHTPGHVANHLCFLLDNPKWLFAGDMVMDGSTVVIAPPDGDMSDYMKSLRLLSEAEIESIAPAHGRLIGEPRRYLQSLIEHRLGREKKVVDGLTKLGAATLGDLLPVVYDDVPVLLHQAAAMSLEAHLLKLLGDQRVVNNRGSNTWSIRP